ncbi:YjzC family protein, partial [Staphylococcus nepalensis]
MTQNTTYKTGEKAPENGTFKVDSLVSGNSSENDTTKIDIEKGEQFPPS